MVDNIKVAAFQTLPPFGDVEAAKAELEKAVKAAAAWGADILVTPEVLFPGYNQADIIRELDEATSKEWLTWLSGITKEYGCAVVLGYAERSGDKIYNCAVCMDENGDQIAYYRKVQLFATETDLYTPGDCYEIFDYKGVKMCLMICYDIEFAHHWRELGLRGVDLILAPTANMQPYQNISDIILPARAAETNISVVYANYCGVEKDLDYAGRSLIAGVGGHLYGFAGEAPCLLLADIPARVPDDHPLKSVQEDSIVEIKD